MAAVPITISGVLCDKYGRTIQPVTIVGEATITGLGVGGGPIIPPSGGSPPVIWPGPGDPDYPIGLPPGIWPNPPEGQAPIPEHPIVIPPPGGNGGPPLQIKVVWTPQTGWQVVLIPTGPHPSPSA